MVSLAVAHFVVDRTNLVKRAEIEILSRVSYIIGSAYRRLTNLHGVGLHRAFVASFE